MPAPTWSGAASPARSESGSFVEDRLSALVDDSAGVGRFPVDVFHPDVAAGRLTLTRGGLTMVADPMRLVGPRWAAEAAELTDLLPPHVAAAPQWDGGAGEELEDWLDVLYFRAATWPSTPSWSVQATASGPRLPTWVRSNPAVEYSARRGGGRRDDWQAIGQRGRVTYGLAGTVAAMLLERRESEPTTVTSAPSMPTSASPRPAPG